MSTSWQIRKKTFFSTSNFFSSLRWLEETVTIVVIKKWSGGHLLPPLCTVACGQKQWQHQCSQLPQIAPLKIVMPLMIATRQDPPPRHPHQYHHHLYYVPVVTIYHLSHCCWQQWSFYIPHTCQRQIHGKLGIDTVNPFSIPRSQRRPHYHPHQQHRPQTIFPIWVEVSNLFFSLIHCTNKTWSSLHFRQHVIISITFTTTTATKIISFLFRGTSSLSVRCKRAFWLFRI